MTENENPPFSTKDRALIDFMFETKRQLASIREAIDRLDQRIKALESQAPIKPW